MQGKKKKPADKTDSKKNSGQRYVAGEDFEKFITSMEYQNRALGKIIHYLAKKTDKSSFHID
jgi:hypothetical protein